MLYKIPLSKIPNQIITTQINGVRVVIEFITRNEKLYINNLSLDDELKISGVVCYNNLNLLLYPTQLNGKLYFKDTQGKDDPKWYGLNERWILLYED